MLMNLSLSVIAHIRLASSGTSTEDLLKSPVIKPIIHDHVLSSVIPCGHTNYQHEDARVRQLELAILIMLQVRPKQEFTDNIPVELSTDLQCAVIRSSLVSLLGCAEHSAGDVNLFSTLTAFIAGVNPLKYGFVRIAFTIFGQVIESSGRRNCPRAYPVVWRKTTYLESLPILMEPWLQPWFTLLVDGNHWPAGMRSVYVLL